jgi:hypothetical protein
MCRIIKDGVYKKQAFEKILEKSERETELL